MKDLHLYDQDRRWCAGGPLVPGLELAEALRRVACAAATLPPDAPTYHERGQGPGRCGKPALYAYGGAIRPLPAASGPADAGPVFAGDARDRHLLGAR